MRRKIVHITLYAVYAVIALAVFLYFLFPYDSLRDYLVASFSEGNAGMSLAIGDISPGFPPTVELKNFRLGRSENMNVNFQAQKVSVRPGLSSLIRGKSSLIFSSRTYEGSIAGEIEFSKMPAGCPIKLELQGSNLNVGLCSYVSELMGRQISGTLRGNVQFRGDPRDWPGGAGSADFTLQNGKYQLLENMLGLDRIDYNVIETQAKLSNRVLKVAKLNVSGDKFRCNLKGDINLNPEIKNSRIELNGTLEITGMPQKLNIGLSGTIGNPATKII